ncbi:hypothetical protein IRJ41_009911, partial [Triplophysa rosa]
SRSPISVVALAAEGRGYANLRLLFDPPEVFGIPVGDTSRDFAKPRPPRHIPPPPDSGRGPIRPAASSPLLESRLPPSGIP